MANTPRVSIGLPVYNGANYVAEAIESLLGQSYGDLELIISDNGSSDETPDICRAFVAADARVRYYREEKNRGVAWNFNRVLELARGEYFKWAAHDDLNAPHQVARLVAILDAHPDVVLAGFQTAVIDERGACLAGVSDRASSPANVRSARLGDARHDDALLNFEPAWREAARRRHTASASPWTRFHGVLLDSQRCYEAFALVRTAALRSTNCYQPYRGCEKVILAELALRGRFMEAPEVLFFSRWHDDRYSASTSAREQQLHFDPETKRKWAAPFQLRCSAEYFRAVGRAPISVGQKLLCGGVMLRFLLQLSKWPGIVSNALSGRGDATRMPPRLERLGRHPNMPDALSLSPDSRGEDASAPVLHSH